ncbi:kyphoscoliosis peptidase-like [Emydura macquarii macquarii]|uniref:kyphoscoliosis peptidase-like n=1 Tax=Emydura macquarii macquarii TaxID=1129001 RepID=UPI00352B920C
MKMDCDRGKPSKPQDVNVSQSVPTICSASGNANCHKNHPIKGPVRQAQGRNQSQKPARSHEDIMSVAGKESQRSDFYNGNVVLQCTSGDFDYHASEKLHQRVVEESRQNGKAIPKEIMATKSIADTPKDSPIKRVFLSGEKKVGRGSKTTLKKSTFHKPLEKTPVQMEGCSPLSISREGPDGLRRERQALSSITQRKTRRDLFPDSKVFSHIDAHVLRVSEQMKPRQALSSVQTIVRLITDEAQSQLETVRAIWMWLCHNIRYDVDGFLGLSQKIHTPEQVLETGRGVCSGYARLCREMCREAGLSCIEVPGYGRSTGCQGGQNCQQKKSNHMWNAVKLEGQWHLLDACWGAGIVDAEKRLFIPSYDDFFFLPDPAHFIETHWPDEPEWQLLQPHVSLEDFEQRVFKTSEFFRLQLSLLSPNCSLLTTEHGEATVSLASAHPAEFSYHLSKLCGEVSKEDLGTTHGLLTVSEKSMTLKVLPPTEGLFELMVFARPMDAQDPYRWVCSYQTKCLESKKKELPENPFHFWGLHPKGKDFGIEDCSCTADLVVVTTGTLLLTLQTSRPLLATYELVNKDLDASLSPNCLASQTEEEKLTCHVLCPFLGYYRLSVFVKDLGGDLFKNAANFLLRCSGSVNQNELFPSGLSMHCGAGISTSWRGFSNPSHPAPIINTNQGKCNITFSTPSDTEVAAILSKDKVTSTKYPLERYTLLTHLGNKVSACILLPESGLYKVGLFSKNKEHRDFAHVCDYVIRCFSEPRWLPFPRVYSTWRRGCVLLQPRTGVLREQSWMRFRVKMPKTYRALVVGQARTELQLTRNKIWEGEVYTGLAGTVLKLAVKFSQQSTSLDVVLSFDVEGSSPSSEGVSRVNDPETRGSWK